MSIHHGLHQWRKLRPLRSRGPNERSATGHFPSLLHSSGTTTDQSEAPAFNFCLQIDIKDVFVFYELSPWS